MAKRSSKASNSTRQLLSNMKLDSSIKFKVEEAYKSIRANLMFSVMKKGCKTFVITSSVPNEGKTTTAVHLSIAFAQADQKVLLIDGDLRKPKIHQYFSLPSAPGLTNYLGSKVSGSGSEKITLPNVIHSTEFKNLYVLNAGSVPPNPAELLSSEPMEDFLKEVSASFDYIIIDTPPINVVSDAMSLIRESDGVVLVVRQNQTTHPEIQKTLSSLEFIDAKILGFVISNSESSARGGYGYGGSYRYGKHYGYGYGQYGTYASYAPYAQREQYDSRKQGE